MCTQKVCILKYIVMYCFQDYDYVLDRIIHYYYFQPPKKRKKKSGSTAQPDSVDNVSIGLCWVLKGWPLQYLVCLPYLSEMGARRGCFCFRIR